MCCVYAGAGSCVVECKMRGEKLGQLELPHETRKRLGYWAGGQPASRVVVATASLRPKARCSPQVVAGRQAVTVA